MTDKLCDITGHMVPEMISIPADTHNSMVKALEHFANHAPREYGFHLPAVDALTLLAQAKDGNP